MIRLFTFVIAAFFISNCAVFRPFPGTKKEIQSGKETCKPIIESIERYHTQHNYYPTDLNQIVPGYSKQKDFEIFYSEGVRGTYHLGFNYPSWETSFCSYQPEEGWDCLTKY